MTGAEERLDVRLVPAALAGWASSAATLVLGPPLLVVAVVALLLVVPLVVRPSRERGLRGALALVLVVVAATGTVAALRADAARPGLVGRLAADRATAVAELEVAGDPLVLTGRARSRVLVRAHLVGLTVRPGGDGACALRAPVVVLGSSEWAGLVPGAVVRAPVRLAPAGRRTEAATLSARAPPQVLADPPRWQRTAAGLRDGLRRLVADRSADVRGLVPGMVLGDTAAVPAGLREAERTTGLTHLTAVSGANVAVVLGAVLLAARAAGAGRRTRLGLGLASVVGFVVLVRPQPSVLRAAVMGSVLLLAVSRGHARRGLPALCAAVVVLLVVDPWLALAPGFALSVLATAALLTVAPRWTARLAGHGVPVPVAAAVAVATAAHLATVPVIAVLSGEVSLVAVLANLLAEPAVVPVTVAGSLAVVLEPLAPPAAEACATVAAAGAWWVARVARTCAGLPAASVPRPGGPAGLVALAVGSALLLRGRPRRRRRG